MRQGPPLRWRHICRVFVLVLLVGFFPDRARGVCGNGVIDGAPHCSCPCDCDFDLLVTVDEIVKAVNIALGVFDICRQGDCDQSGSITVDEIITCVNNALNGCPASATGAEEDCDDGGLCVGGANAGTPCNDEVDCVGDGACFGGINDLRGCVTDDDCAGAECRRCRPYGGDGCAANCTAESDLVCNLVPGEVVDGINIQDGTSGATIYGPFLSVPLLFSGRQVITSGRIVAASVPVVIKASTVDLGPLPVGDVACACVRSVEAGTCGGTLYDRDGNASPNCTPGFAEAEPCPAEKPCTAIYGPGNSAAGVIRCNDPGFDVYVEQDCNKIPGRDPYDPRIVITESPASIPDEEGSALLFSTLAISTVVGSCSGTSVDYGPDGEFCTQDDPTDHRGTPAYIPFTTNTSVVEIVNPLIEFDAPPLIDTSGAPFRCNADGSISVGGANLAGVFTDCDQPTVADLAGTVNFVCE